MLIEQVADACGLLRLSSLEDRFRWIGILTDESASVCRDSVRSVRWLPSCATDRWCTAVLRGPLLNARQGIDFKTEIPTQLAIRPATGRRWVGRRHRAGDYKLKDWEAPLNQGVLRVNSVSTKINLPPLAKRLFIEQTLFALCESDCV